MKSVMRKKLEKIIAAVLVMTLTILPQSISVFAETATGTDSISADQAEALIRDNISIKGKDVSGMSYHQALEALGGEASIGDASVTLTSRYGDISTTLSELGLYDDTEEVVKKALEYGNSGNVLKRFKDIEQLKNTPVNFDVKKEVDADTLDKVIEGKIGNEMNSISGYSLEKHDDGTVKVNVEGESVSVDVEATKATIDDAINADGYSGGAITKGVVLADNSGSEKMQQIARVKDLLGTYTTSYASSGPARKNNVQRAASLVDGHLLFPGEQLSVYNTIAPIEVSNGYEMAHTYVGTEVVDGAGGGVCQVATTLYNAAIRAEIEILQRNCHSMKVSYVPISADAAIAGGVLDLRIKNNLSAPIYIEALYDGANLSFNVWGEEYREPGRLLTNESTLRKLDQYLEREFLQKIAVYYD